ncbi:MAG TPA: phosphoribosylglycinamide formyltransferase [Bacteroidales bacterium]|jgi:phosphoribosylglycinamide formyltransferase-1|nr:phosphoribosylglycinamide formyltransferase [Bacteroidales bacterium]HQH25193.1 phosphoribosylglycinamide formyltransferase [Bacteroidales bacterium]HQK70092.1 phosphoribosylglycinamide formyltransferase [Bacteroidales bacterium]
MKNIAIFASGSGTNAENIIRYFSNSDSARVVLVLSNRSDAFVLKRAKALSVETLFFERGDFYGSGRVPGILQARNIDFIVLAGFLWLVPEDIIERYEGRIINIHPALLPKYGGRGMYGDRVHRAVIQGCEKESGISIHYVNNNYDEGDIIFQAKCMVEPSDTAETLARKIHELEYRYYPGIIEDLVKNLP